jgi:hypothetical protein
MTYVVTQLLAVFYTFTTGFVAGPARGDRP